MKKIGLLLLALLFMQGVGYAASSKKAFEIRDGHFYKNGKVVSLYSGEFHYARVPHQYWRQRLKMMRAMGLNTVATYVFWNAHEPQPGKWDFSGDLDLAQFIRTAGEEGLMVILRPGPYVCAEWEFGGYPWWLLNEKDIQLRQDNPVFLKYTQAYLNRLAKEVGNLQCTKGGPIIMVQCENEFGSYAAQRTDIPLASHQAYNAKIKQQLSDAGFDAPLFTSDGSWLFKGGSTPGALPTANGEGNVENLKKVVNEYHGGKGPYMVAEFYPGWLDHWCEPFNRHNPHGVVTQMEKYLKNDVSFNIYMAFGGTNFGFTAGANYNQQHDIQPDITSYDYDAPISEAGWPTPKFDSIRTLLKRYANYSIPAVPPTEKVITIPEIKLSKVGNLLNYAQTLTAVDSDEPLTFEKMEQGYGYMLYQHHFNQPFSGKLEVKGLRDYAVVYVDGVKKGELNRYNKQYTMDIEVPFNSNLQILVENMGRINYGEQIPQNNKGIISTVFIDGMGITDGWQNIGIPMSEQPDLSAWNGNAADNTSENAAKSAGQPVVYEGTFNLNDTGDTFLNMEPFGKGIVFVNGHNLGRYWNVGPQQTLYLPGCWLNKGENKIVIFEQLNDNVPATVSAVAKPVLDKLNR